MQIRSIINKEYIPALLHISSKLDGYQDLWYNGQIIGTVSGEYELIIKFNSFAKIHCSISESKSILVVSDEYELHRELAEYDFSTLNKGLR